MSLSLIEKDYCQTVTKKFINHSLAYPFLYPVDKKLAPDYYDFIKKPMDLSTIQKKLDNNSYSSSKEWANDLMLIWKNAVDYNKSPNDLIHIVALVLKEKASKKIKIIPKNEKDLWYLKLLKAARAVERELNKSSRGSKSKR
jgi:transcriptional activator SPT7